MMFVVNARVQVVVAQEKVEKRVDDSLGSKALQRVSDRSHEALRRVNLGFFFSLDVQFGGLIFHFTIFWFKNNFFIVF